MELGYSSNSDSEFENPYQHDIEMFAKWRKADTETFLPGENDPLAIEIDAYNSSLMELKEDLLDAVRNRKKSVLPTAI